MTGSGSGDDAAHRARGFRWTGVAAGVLTAGLGLVPLTRSEPSPRLLPVALAGLIVVVALGFAIGHRRSVLVVPPVIGAVLCVAAAFAAEPVHWRWSVDAFDDAIDGGDLGCTAQDPCRVGWWSVEELTPDPQLPTVWLRTSGTGSCYAGWAIARPADGLAAAEARALAEQRDDQRGFLEVREWYDGWVELCYTT